VIAEVPCDLADVEVYVSDVMAQEQAGEGGAIPLSTVAAGRKVRLAKVDAGQNLKSRLAAMGLVPSVEMTVVRNGHPGPFVISVKGSKVMLGRGMAQKIMVM
jgi:Fe2+ transport system protein FeoA